LGSGISEEEYVFWREGDFLGLLGIVGRGGIHHEEKKGRMPEKTVAEGVRGLSLSRGRGEGGN